MENQKPSVRTSKLNTGSRTFFMDLKLAQNQKHYVTINESRKDKEGNPVYNKIMLFEEDVPKFIAAFQELLKGVVPTTVS